MKKILLLTVGLFSISTAYSMCVPFPLPVKCNCAFPVLEDNKIAYIENYSYCPDNNYSDWTCSLTCEDIYGENSVACEKGSCISMGKTCQ